MCSLTLACLRSPKPSPTGHIVLMLVDETQLSVSSAVRSTQWRLTASSLILQRAPNVSN